MSYENAPATSLLATKCACCGRPLVDAVSVETGVGPDCRKKYGYDKPDGLVNPTAFWAAVQEGGLGIAVQEIVASDAPEDDYQRIMDGERVVANRLVYGIATGALSARAHAAAIRAVAALGFVKLAAKLAEVSAVAEITVEADAFVVRTPKFDERLVESFRRIPGRRWDGALKANRFPLTMKRAVWDALRRLYPGALIQVPDGVREIPAQAA